MNRRALILVAALAACGNTKNPSLDAAADSKPSAGDALDASTGETLDASGAGDVLSSDGATVDRLVTGDLKEAGEEDAQEAGQPGDAGLSTFTLPASCAGAATPPSSLVCTGLYANIVTKQIAPGIEAYTPAVPLWSDGATKQRWIYLPPGMKIDNTDANEWVFPIGTKVWKEFSRDGRRVETRLWQKVSATYWVDTTYQWSDDETSATQTDGGDIPWGDGGTYHIPTPDECQQCHRGRSDRILGFEQGLLGLAGAQGLTLGQLAADGRLTVPPPSGPLVIGDDGTGLAAPALAWLHVNCGTTCHNQNSSATAWSTGLFMRLDATQLDGRSVAGFDTLTTTNGVAAVSPAWRGKTRIVAHDPAHSLLYQLISHRGTGNQMPPIASSVVDEADIPLVEAWIEDLSPPKVTSDGGTDGEHTEAGTEETSGAGNDASSHEAGHDEGHEEPLPDAGVDAPVDASQSDDVASDS